MKIKLIKALKVKNRIVAKLSRTRELIGQENRYIDEFDFNINELMDENSQWMDWLIELKTKINKANQPIQGKIFELSEKKAFLRFLQGVSVKKGAQKDRYDSEPTVWKVQMEAEGKEEIVNGLQKEIDIIQDELDAFNATHSIDVSFNPDEI